MKRSRSNILSLVAFVLVFAGCESRSSAPITGVAGETVRITLTGSSTIAPLMLEVGKRFEEMNPGVRIDVQTGGSSRGVADARGELADIGMVSRAMKPDEQDLQAFAIARDGVCVILHRDNPVRSLTNEQIVGIYTGKVTHWNEVGGTDATIVVVNKAEGRSTLEIFCSYFQLEPSAIEADIVIGDNEQGVKTVAGNPHAIGYVSVGTAEYDRDIGVPIALLGVDGIDATSENVANGTFPISRVLNLVTLGPPTGHVLELIEYTRSDRVHDLVKELAFVPIR